MRRLICTLAISVLSTFMVGCSCTSSYPLSFVTLGVGRPYCKAWTGAKCCPDGKYHAEDVCGCSKSCSCWEPKDKSK
jgi:hypothetical protein